MWRNIPVWLHIDSKVNFASLDLPSIMFAAQARQAQVKKQKNKEANKIKLHRQNLRQKTLWVWNFCQKKNSLSTLVPSSSWVYYLNPLYLVLFLYFVRGTWNKFCPKGSTVFFASSLKEWGPIFSKALLCSYYKADKTGDWRIILYNNLQSRIELSQPGSFWRKADKCQRWRAEAWS